MSGDIINRAYWDGARAEAFRLDNAELRRHALVSISNRHECGDCFCCACLAELRQRVETGRASAKDLQEDRDDG